MSEEEAKVATEQEETAEKAEDVTKEHEESTATFEPVVSL